MNGWLVEETTQLQAHQVTTPDTVSLTITIPWRLGKTLTQEVAITKTRLFSGGIRRWFVCPKCGCRAGKLYAPPYKNFTCRKCGGLQYASQYPKGAS